MLDTHSPLAGLKKEADLRFERDGLSLTESKTFQLTQYAGKMSSIERITGMKFEFGKAQSAEGRTVMQVGTSQIWVIGPPLETKALYATPLSSGRTRLVLEGENARALLFACAPVDFSPSVFTANHYAMTGIHHCPVTVHCVRGNTFHLYVMRTFAHSLWEWLTDAAEGI